MIRRGLHLAGAAAIALGLSAPGLSTPAVADVIDMAEATCEIFNADAEEGTAYVFWIDGYLSAESGDTRVSEDWFEKLIGHIAEECVADPDQKILDIARELIRQ